MRFLLDENLPEEVGAVLRVGGHDVLHVADTHLRGKAGEYVVREADDTGRLLITLDLGISEPRDRPTTGLILLRIPSKLVRRLAPQLVRDVLLNMSETELRGHITVIEPGQVRNRPLR